MLFLEQKMVTELDVPPFRCLFLLDGDTIDQLPLEGQVLLKLGRIARSMKKIEDNPGSEFFFGNPKFGLSIEMGD